MKRVTFFTGAGISAESGVPTFRTGAGALWENHRIEDVCHIDTFERNYALVHQFYNQRRENLAAVTPNPAHQAIADLQQQYGERVRLLTTNIDDLHERAGSPGVRHIHGNLLELVDLRNGQVLPLGYESFDYAAHPRHFKPNVVFFGEAAPVYRELFELMNSLTAQDLVVVIGSSETVIAFCAEAHYGSNGTATIFYIDPTEQNHYDRNAYIPFDRHFCSAAVAALGQDAEALQAIRAWLES